MALTDDIQVLIPYKRLVELLQASEELEAVRNDYARLEKQILALRLIQSECMNKIRDLEQQL